METLHLEDDVARIWRELLGVESVQREDDFFVLGGDSLLAVRMLAAVEDTLLVPVSFVDFIDAPTFGALADLVAREQAAAGPGVATAQPQAAPEGSPPVTFAQDRLLFVAQLTGGTGVYNMPLGVRVRGAIDAGALEQSLLEIVRRHDALRTTFGIEDGRAVQIVAPELNVQLEQHDLRAYDDPEEEAQRLVDTAAGRPFDLERGPLLRAQLLRLGDEDHVLQFVFDHIVCDGLSHVVIFRELEALYRAYADGDTPVLPAPRVQYPAFARQQREQLQGAVLEEKVARWRDRLAGLPAALELPTDRPRPAVPSYAGASYRMPLPAATAAAVRAFARTQGATPFAVLLTVFDVLLYRNSGQETIAIGTTAAGRDRPELEQSVGLFASTVVLRTELGDEPSFGEQLRRVRDVVLDAVAHHDAPFEALVAELQPERDPSRHPLFQVFFAHVPYTPLGLEGAEPFDADPGTARFDLTLWVEEEADEGIEIVWEYSTDLFDAETIERLGRQFVRLLTAGLADPTRAIDDLPLLDEDERRAALEAAGDSAVDYPVACLHELFAQQAARTPAAVAVAYESDALTYAELDVRANRLAHTLRASGVGEETLVALCLERSVDLAVAILGVLKAGGAYVPLDPEYPSERLAFVLKDAAVPVLVTQERLLDRLPPHDATVVSLDGDAALLEREPATAPEPLATPESLAYVIYTSGSTGQPKGVQVEHRNVARLFTATDGWFGFGPQDTWVLLHSYAFDFSVWELWGALLYGGRLVVAPQWTTRAPDALAELLVAEQVTVLNVTPSLFTTALEEIVRVGDGLALRYVVFGGEALSPPTLRPWFTRFGDRGARLVNMYGITETTVHVTYRPVTAEDSSRETSPIGEPIPDLQTYVLDGKLEPVPVGVAGELYVGGAGVARGYLNRPELTAERFLPNPFGPGRLYRSGDRARRLSGGGLEYLGRNDDQVKIRGFRIEVGEVQAVLAEHEKVADCAVVAFDAGPGDTRLAAYVVPSAGAAFDDHESLRRLLRTSLEEQLPSFMVPSALTLVDRLPLTPNGKLDRRALPAPTLEVQEVFVPPQTPTQEHVAEVWCRVLAVERVGADDNFFHLGGHSLLAARVVTQVRERFAIDLSVRALFEHPTLAAFAEAVDAASGSVDDEVATVGAVEERAAYPLSFLQQQLLFFDELSRDTYNAALAVHVEGELDRDALRAALAAVFERHEALRTVLRWGDHAPEQIVLDSWTVELPVVDLSHVPAEQRDEELQELMREHARRPFDLRTDLMLRTTLFKLADAEHLILFQPHHIAVDGWSVDILFRELAEVYDASRSGRAPDNLPALTLQYRDFAVWQRDLLQGDVLAKELGYWREQLAGAPTDIALPTDRPRPPLQSFDGASHVVVLPRDVADGVQRLCRTAGATPYMLLLSVFGALLYRRTGQDDILFGSPMANRGRAEFEQLIGFFANTIVVRVRLAGNPPFVTLVERVRESALGAYDHQHVPFEQIVEAVRPQRDPGVNPLFQVNFRVRVGEPPQLELSGATTRRLPVDVGSARFDLALELQLADNGLVAELIYNTDLFDEATIVGLSADFEALLSQVLADPAMRLLSLDVPSELAARGNGPAARAGGIRRFREAAAPPASDS